MDWQIQQGTRGLAHGGKDRHGISGLNDMVLAEVALAEQQLDVPAGLAELTVSALLIAAAVMLFFRSQIDGLAAIPIAHALTYAAVGGIAGAFFCRSRDRRANQIHSKETGDSPADWAWKLPADTRIRRPQ